MLFFPIICFSEKLTKWLEEEELESNKTNAVKPLHPHYREVSRIILKNCADTIKDGDQIDQLVQVKLTRNNSLSEA